MKLILDVGMEERAKSQWISTAQDALQTKILLDMKTKYIDKPLAGDLPE